MRSNAATRILVVERDDLIRNLLVEILESNGLRTLATDHCPDPGDVRQLRPEVLLIDPFIATGSPIGWQYLRWLRDQPGLRTLPIVLCTSAPEELRDATSTDLEMVSGAVLKPFDIDELLEAVSAATGPGVRTSPYSWLATQTPIASDTHD